MGKGGNSLYNPIQVKDGGEWEGRNREGENLGWGDRKLLMEERVRAINEEIREGCTREWDAINELGGSDLRKSMEKQGKRYPMEL